MRQKPGLAKPPNLAARALRDGMFRQRTVKNAKTYSRKIKHRKGEQQNGSPFCCPRFSGDQIQPVGYRLQPVIN